MPCYTRAVGGGWRLVCDDTQVTGYDISRGIDGRDGPLFCG